MAAESKEATKVAAAEAEEAEAAARRWKLLKIINVSVMQSVAQHVITLQSEPLLMDSICGGDQVRSNKLLSTCAGITGILSIILNQVGGKLSDALGRKPFLVFGPLGNVCIGALVYANYKSMWAVLLGRILRSTITTFSNTVIIGALIGDALTGKEQAVIGSTIGATIGFGASAIPFLEGVILARTKSPRSTFLLLSALGAIHVLFTTLSMPETLHPSKRVPINKALTLSTFNPVGFINLYTRGSFALQKNVTVTSLQGFMEGKNLSDFSLVFNKENMKWGVVEIRNWIAVYGAAIFGSGMFLTPYLLKNMSVRAYTSFTNWMNIMIYSVRAFVGGRPIAYLACVPFMLPGVNGAGANALKAVASDKAKKEGFGMGEFSAYCNNLRAIVSAIAPIILANWYARAQRKGFGGSTFWLIGFISAVIPELIFKSMRDDELQMG